MRPFSKLESLIILVHRIVLKSSQTCLSRVNMTLTDSPFSLPPLPWWRPLDSIPEASSPDPSPYLLTDSLLRPKTKAKQSQVIIWLACPIRAYQFIEAQTPLWFLKNPLLIKVTRCWCFCWLPLPDPEAHPSHPYLPLCVVKIWCLCYVLFLLWGTTLPYKYIYIKSSSLKVTN